MNRAPPEHKQVRTASVDLLGGDKKKKRRTQDNPLFGTHSNLRHSEQLSKQYFTITLSASTFGSYAGRQNARRALHTDTVGFTKLHSSILCHKTNHQQLYIATLSL